MTVAITQDRLNRTMRLLKLHADKGLPCPTNQDIARAVGMGKQEYQPAGRKIGAIAIGHEAGSVMIEALHRKGLIRAEKIGRNKRRVEIVATGQVIETELRNSRWVP